MQFAPNWAAIAQILGSALSAPEGQYGAGAAQGAQNYQAMQGQRQDQQYRQQQMDFQRQQAERAAAADQDRLRQEQQYQDMFRPQPVAGPGGPQANMARATDPFSNISAQDRAMLKSAGATAGLPMLWDLQHREADAPKTVGGMQWNPATGAFERIPGYTEQAAAIAAAGRNPAQGGDASGVGLELFYTQDADGTLHAWQPSRTGQPVEVKLPQGQKFSPGVQYLNTGTGFVPADKRSGQVVGDVVPIDVAGEKSAQVQGEAQGQAIVDLPGAIAKADEARSVIKKLKEHPGRSYATGKSSILPIIPGTAPKDFEVLLKQSQGGVFLQAYQQLKGGGAITAIEGEKGEQAIARLDRAQTEGEFVAALNDLDAVIQAGTERLKTRAGQGGTPYVNNDPLGIR